MRGPRESFKLIRSSFYELLAGQSSAFLSLEILLSLVNALNSHFTFSSEDLFWLEGRLAFV